MLNTRAHTHQVFVEFEAGETHGYKAASWHKLSVTAPAERDDPLASRAIREAGLTVGTRVEHPKHGRMPRRDSNSER